MHCYQVSPIPYTFLHQRPQKIADQLLARGMRVTYIEPCGLREFLSGRRKGLARNLVHSLLYHVLGLAALAFPVLRRKPTGKGSRCPAPGHIEIIAMPLIIPNNRVSSPFLERLNASIFRQVLRRKVFRYMDPGEANVALIQNPFYGAVIEAGDFDKVFYDCLDEISLYSGRTPAERFLVHERRLVEHSDALFVTAESLEDHLRSLDIPRPIIRVPNGVDADWFKERALAGTMPEDLQNIPRPIVGYVGVIYDWIDYGLIEKLARRMPDVSFVFVGPVDYQERIADLKNCRNVYWLGRKEYELVPLYIKEFSVCLIPFRVGRISRTTNPVKVFEYFALGKPVVSTRLVELEPFAERDLLSISDTEEGFITAVSSALQADKPELVRERQGVADEHSWAAHAATMQSVFRSQGGHA